MRGLLVGLCLVLLPSSLAADSILDCPGLEATPDLGACFVAGSGLGGELAVLGQIACVVGKIDEWGAQQLACLQKGLEARHRQILYPDALLKPLSPLRALVKQAETLKQEVESLACGWRFSGRTALLQGIYLNPLKLCRTSFQLAFGSHEGGWDAGIQEMMDWTSTSTHNLIQERTSGTGLDDGPEYSWQTIAQSSASALAETLRTPGQAVRLAAQLSADDLRASRSTLDIETQQLLVEQQARDYRGLKRRQERAFRLWLLFQLQGPSAGAPEILQ